MTWLVWLALACLLVLLGFSVYLNLRLAKVIFALEDQLEESLDILDENYQHMAHAATIPVMSDEPVVRDVINRIKSSRDALLLIAHKMTVFNRTNDSPGTR